MCFIISFCFISRLTLALLFVLGSNIFSLGNTLVVLAYFFSSVSVIFMMHSVNLGTSSRLPPSLFTQLLDILFTLYASSSLLESPLGRHFLAMHITISAAPITPQLECSVLSPLLKGVIDYVRNAATLRLIESVARRLPHPPSLPSHFTPTMRSCTHIFQFNSAY